MNYAKKIYSYYRENGKNKFFRKIRVKIKKTISVLDNKYDKWVKAHLFSQEERQKQINYNFERTPLISIVVPAYNTPVIYLSELIESVLAQTYTNWELCIADGNSSKEETKNCLKEYSKIDNRIKPVFLKENRGISGNTNAAIDVSKGEYVVFSDHDDLLASNALFEIVSVFLSTNADYVYSDEDRINETSERFFSPRFKPDYDPEYLICANYMCHLSAIKKDALLRIGLLNSKYDGSQDHELNLRIMEAGLKIYHIPKMLYHWRKFEKSFSRQSLDRCLLAARKAINDYFNRNDIIGEANEVNGRNRVSYTISDTPLVSILVHGRITNNYLAQLKQKTDYKWIEFITEPLEAKGEFLVFLNSGILPENKDWLEEMLMLVSQKQVTAVGGAVFDQRGRTLHRGLHFVEGRLIRSFSKTLDADTAYLNMGEYVHNVSAVDGEFCITRTEQFCEYIRNNPNTDFIQYCLSLYDKNQRVVFTPYAYAYLQKGEEYSSLSTKKYNLPFSIDPFFNNTLAELMDDWPTS